MKKTLWFSVLSLVIVGLVYAGTNKISRFPSLVSAGGSTSTSGFVLVTGESATNEFRVVPFTATVAGSATSATNTFTTAFLATPTVVFSPAAGVAPSVISAVTVTASTTGIVTTGLAAVGTTNNIQGIAYGYTRTGVFE